MDKRQIKHLQELSLTDELTGLPNRRAFDDRLGHKIEEGRRGGPNFTLAMCDIDFFKRVNDELGHPAGDQVLAELARIFILFLRKSDEVFRCGGEEFALLLAHPDPHKNPSIPLERLRVAVETADFRIRRQVTISLGYATFSPEMDNKAIIDAADKALYRAKNSGRNRVCS